ncbi:acid protease [Pleomassaria siparia CBS 279.74]|uniref:Acid protease n=1 Tax=Pleomassaria siparia CBS 279.74 TaxID=1314801 RepID=A0A6G1JQV2_9PLEO|nr:acid protease [Pleomassaria siparia CBS 279.74]
MTSLAFYLTATVLLAQSTVAFNCSTLPVYVDIHRRAVHDSPVFQYGSFIGVGSQAQNQSLWPSLSQNHISFAGANYCNKNGTVDVECTKHTGGTFNPEDSTTFINMKNFQSLDKNSNQSFVGTFGQDDVHLYTHYFETDGASQTLLPNSTIEIATSGSIQKPSIVGMGLDSTVLQDLVTNNLIAGKTYSLYIGQGFERASGLVNGSNVFGGYDSGRFTGQVHQYDMKEANLNPMTVTVKDIYISDPNGANVSLFDTAAFPSMTSQPAQFEAQITTDQYPLSLPYQITQNFISHLNAEEDNYWGDHSLKLKDAFSGSLSIVLDDGFTVTIPSEVLSNVSNITPIQSRPNKTDDQPFLLSAAFLTQVYLMADFEARQFYLAQAIQKNNVVMPQTFCPRSIPVAYQRPKQSKWVSQGLVGAVIGGVIGGIGILAFLWCFILGYKRRRAEKKAEARQMEEGRKAKFAQMDIEEFDPPPKANKKPSFWKKG